MRRSISAGSADAANFPGEAFAKEEAASEVRLSVRGVSARGGFTTVEKTLIESPAVSTAQLWASHRIAEDITLPSRYTADPELSPSIVCTIPTRPATRGVGHPNPKRYDPHIL
jgi:hypothetical protein